MTARKSQLWQEAQGHTRRTNWTAAKRVYATLTREFPDFIPAWLELSSAQEKLDEYRDSRQSTLQAAAAGGATIDPMLGLAIARRLKLFEETDLLLAYIDATSLKTRVPSQRLLDVAMLVSSTGNHAEALDLAHQAARENPNFAEAYHVVGLFQMFLGENEKSILALQRAVTLQPSHGPSHFLLSRLVKATPSHNQIELLRTSLSRPDIPNREEVHYAYALHNQLHALGRHQESWDALTRACMARKSVHGYDHMATMQLFERQRRLFADPISESDARAKPSVHAHPVPIFVVGMHRSGTTLLERMLSGHSDIADAGETYTFTAQLRYASDHFCANVADTDLVDGAQLSDPALIGARFTSAIRARAEGRGFITEKLNQNFILLGQIAKCLPQARILHMRRDAADTCFSNLRTLFTKEAIYSYDQLEVADYYKAYIDMMDHWSRVLGSRVFHIEYQQLVTQPEATIRAICDFCGIEFEPAMLHVGRAGGSIATASSTQIRQGIVSDRGGAWRAYHAQLRPMLERLVSHGLAQPSEISQ